MIRPALLCLGALLPLGLSAAMLQNVAIPAPAVVVGATNLTPSTAISLALDEKLPFNVTGGRIYVSLTGGGTNTFVFVTTGDGTNWESATSSPFRLSGVGNLSGWFQFLGVKRVALASVTNAMGGSVSNLSIRLFYAPN